MVGLLQVEEVRDRLARIGKTAVDVAGELDVPVPVVRGVLSGKLKGARGDAHKVAVTLGLKDGVIVADDTPLSEAMRIAKAN
ncbi:hypothetical protein HY78_15660 [Rhizorhabdus wittichii DC-6]|nr:hypothetical protein HY78_15660 [Rhizorhabdus wittichii DC-6]